MPPTSAVFIWANALRPATKRAMAPRNRTRIFRLSLSQRWVRSEPSRKLFGHAPEADVVVFVPGLEPSPVRCADEIRLVPPAAASQRFVFRRGGAGGVDRLYVVLHRIPGVSPLDDISEHVV